METLQEYLKNNQISILEFLNSADYKKVIKILKPKLDGISYIGYGKDSNFIKNNILRFNKSLTTSTDAIYIIFNYDFYKKEIKSNIDKFLEKIDNIIKPLKWFCNLVCCEVSYDLEDLNINEGMEMGEGDTGMGFCVILCPFSSLYKIKKDIVYHVTAKEFYDKTIQRTGLRIKGVYTENETPEEVMMRCNDINGNKSKYHKTQNYVSYSPRIFVTASNKKSTIKEIVTNQTQCYKKGLIPEFEPIVLTIDLSKHNIDLYHDQNNNDKYECYYCLTNIPSKLISVNDELTAYVSNLFNSSSEISKLLKEEFNKLSKLSHIFKNFIDKYEDDIIENYYISEYNTNWYNYLNSLLFDYKCDVQKMHKETEGEYFSEYDELVYNFTNRLSDNKINLDEAKDAFIEHFEWLTGNNKRGKEDGLKHIDIKDIDLNKMVDEIFKH